MVKKLLLTLAVALMPALVAAQCMSDFECSFDTGAKCSNGVCTRTLGCSSNAECRSAAKTGNTNALCDVSLNACFVPSTNLDGIAEGQPCAFDSARRGDDFSCAFGLICRGNVCNQPSTVVQAMGCPNAFSCGPDAPCSGGTCSRFTGCGSDADCARKTGSARARCDRANDACFVASDNLLGSSEGSGCGGDPLRKSDDNSCAYGLVCRDNRCRSNVLGAICATSSQCPTSQTCVIPSASKRSNLFIGGTCTAEDQPSPLYKPGLPGKYKRSLRVGQDGVQDTRAVIRGRQALTPRQFRTKAQSAEALA